MQSLSQLSSAPVAAARAADRQAPQQAAARQHSAACPLARQPVHRKHTALAAVVTDQAVPEGHKGLHGFLYGESGAEVHDQQSSYHFRQACTPFQTFQGSVFACLLNVYMCTAGFTYLILLQAHESLVFLSAAHEPV